MLFTEEVKNIEELTNEIVKLNLTNVGKVKICVACFIFDEDGKVILHRRGPGARDEIGKLLAIGGSYNKTDSDFRSALMRELKEEAGEDANIRIDKFIGALLDGKVDNTNGEFTNWIILAYKGTLLNGNLINIENDRCIGFEKNTLEGFLDDDLSNSARKFVEYMLYNSGE